MEPDAGLQGYYQHCAWILFAGLKPDILHLCFERLGPSTFLYLISVLSSVGQRSSTRDDTRPAIPHTGWACPKTTNGGPHASVSVSESYTSSYYAAK